MLRSQRRGRRAMKQLAPGSELRLTSMMDILTTLLLFVLKSFVVSGEVVPPPGLELPTSSATEQPQSSLVVAIDDDVILLGDERIATVEEVTRSSQMLIPALDARLEAVRKQREGLATLRGDEFVEEQVVTIQGDRKIEFQVLHKVMYTLHYNGLQNIALAVFRGKQGPPA